jgi:hypothetical protein
LSEDYPMKVLLCYVCGRRYKNQEQLERHLASGHPDLRVREQHFTALPYALGGHGFVAQVVPDY